MNDDTAPPGDGWKEWQQPIGFIHPTAWRNAGYTLDIWRKEWDAPRRLAPWHYQPKNTEGLWWRLCYDE